MPQCMESCLCCSSRFTCRAVRQSLAFEKNPLGWRCWRRSLLCICCWNYDQELQCFGEFWYILCRIIPRVGTSTIKTRDEHANTVFSWRRECRGNGPWRNRSKCSRFFWCAAAEAKTEKYEGQATVTYDLCQQKECHVSLGWTHSNQQWTSDWLSWCQDVLLGDGWLQRENFSIHLYEGFASKFKRRFTAELL